MSDPATPPPVKRPGRRVPSGARPAPLPLRSSPTASQAASRSGSASALTLTSTTTSENGLRSQQSFASSTMPTPGPETPLDRLLDDEKGFTISPEQSPELPSRGESSTSGFPLRPAVPLPSTDSPRSRTFSTQPLPLGSPISSKTQPTASFHVSRPSTPTSIGSPPPRAKPPKPSKLNTNLPVPSRSATSPTKAVSPGLKHWQQVRHHVLAPSPAEERTQLPNQKKKIGIVSKAAGRFGFKNAAENVMGYGQGGDRRISMMSGVSEIMGLSKEEREEIARERRRFARDLKACLDACSSEESKRRLSRTARHALSDGRPSNNSIHASSHHTRLTFDPNFSAFAPLLSELHRHLPAARAKKPWSRTCPHHSAILAELGVAFLGDGVAREGEGQQALEVFGAVVKNWGADGADEELDRWVWLCHALRTDDRQLRHRGLTLLSSFLHADPSLPRSTERPGTIPHFLRLSSSLIALLHAVESSQNPLPEHLDTIAGLLMDLSEGNIIDLEGKEKEVIWLAISKGGMEDHLWTWLLSQDREVLKRFSPPPILHAMPPETLQLRSLSSVHFLCSFTTLIGSSDGHLVDQIWKCVEEVFIAEISHLPEDETLARHLGALLIAMEVKCQDSVKEEEHGDTSDPFRISMSPRKNSIGLRYRTVLEEMLAGQRWTPGIEAAAKQAVISLPVLKITRMLQHFMGSKVSLSLGKKCLQSFWTRMISLSPAEAQDVKPFLIWLSLSHPQLFYLPLFSLSASTQVSTLSPHLKLVSVVSDIIGPRYWTMADPQMVTIVLIGDVGPKPSKGKGKEGEKRIVNVKLGRYAVLIELLNALNKLDDKEMKAIKVFAESVESKLGIMLDTEERDGSLPDGYRALLCHLLTRLRCLSFTLKRSQRISIIVKWFLEMTNAPVNDVEQVLSLASIYNTTAVVQGEEKRQTSIPDLLQARVPPTSSHKSAIIDMKLPQAATSLLVAVHACLTVEEWESLIFPLWRNYGIGGVLPQAVDNLPSDEMRRVGADPTEEDDFARIVKVGLRSKSGRAILTLASPNTINRSTALENLAKLYGWRYQVLSQPIISDRRVPIFQFSARTLEFVTTEIGSPVWVPPHDVQDAALQKFGPTLPFELRQRLMELGWSEDASTAGQNDWEKIPVTRLPPIQQRESTVAGEWSSPSKTLTRKSSNGSGHSHSGKKRKAVLAPLILGMIGDQASLLGEERNGNLAMSSRELVKMLQRDDPVAFLRPFTEGFDDHLPTALMKLNSALSTVTPGFAYAALNAIVGYLKTVLRTDPKFPHYGIALSTISRLMSSVSEMSLRDIRKNKAEHILLPASIHEDESGFKLHTPWRENQLDVQTVQLLILTEILKTNPREVYLVKKMLSNLQIRGCIHWLPFCRAWLSLISTLFGAVNRNYNDRAELRHFLQNVGAILQLHGRKDLLVSTHAIKVFMLCSARFRRLFTTMGFQTAMGPIYEVYSKGDKALRDCIEYAGRSFYRIHQDSYVYQTCAVIAETEGGYEGSTVYALLASLSEGNSARSGVASGIRGLNDKEEIEALVAMISRPEIALSEIGTAAAERQATKLASVTLEDSVFPRENIVRLFVTVIAANPASTRAVRFMKLFTAIVPSVKDPVSRELLRDGVEALGGVISKGKAGDDNAMSAFAPVSDNGVSDWISARREYVFLVEAFASSGGQLGAQATKRTLEMVLDLLQKQPESVGPAASSIVRGLAKTHLSSARPILFLRDIAQLFRQFIAVVDFSGVLDEITALIKRTTYALDEDTTRAIIDNYVEGSIKMLASASEDNMVFLVPLRSSAVSLLSAAVFLKGDALGTLERQPTSASLLASLVLPLCLMLEPPQDTDRDAVFASLWIRLLHYVIRSTAHGKPKAISTPPSPHAAAATTVLSVQIIKVIIIRAPESISRVKGLWQYIASHLLMIFDDMDSTSLSSVTIIEWIMWSLFELLALHRNPLQISFRFKIQTLLIELHNERLKSRPSTPGDVSKSHSPTMRSRISSVRSPSMAFGGGARTPSGLSLGQTPEHPNHARMPSQHLTPILSGHARTPSHASSKSPFGGGGHSRMPSLGIVHQHLTPGHARLPSMSAARPTFSDLSARRASRPVFDVSPSPTPGTRFRFPSSAPIRSLGVSGEKGAIIHLLSAPTQVLSATSTGFPTLGLGTGQSSISAVREVLLKNETLIEGTRKASRTVQMVFGYPVELQQDEEPVRIWSVHEALHVIVEQTKIFVEDEFRDVFNPAREEWVDVEDEKRESGFGCRVEAGMEEDEGLDLPVLHISSP
ncbi:hypothetical protein P7C73_g2860, partial [Tremellales sp. Uapishka_1]